ncbi:MAG: zinc-binding dehydrogenase, partial [Bacteroidia bacterium]|nr:zinc-binding dehydrogenase [Bacteroidia bacterium]
PMAIRRAYLLGAERVIVIDRLPERLKMAHAYGGAETLDSSQVDILGALKEMTGGRGPDCCIDAVGMEADSSGWDYYYDRIKQTVRIQTDRPNVLKETIIACRRGGTISIVGVYGGLIDKFPMGAAMNKALTLRMGQMHAQRYIPQLLEYIQEEKIDPSYMLTHKMSLEQGIQGYDMFKHKHDSCMRVVFTP